MKKLYSWIFPFMFLTILPGFYLSNDNFVVHINMEPTITIKNETDTEICGVTLEDPNEWPPFISTSTTLGVLREEIQSGDEFSISGIMPGVYDLYIVDCSGRLVFEQLEFVFQGDRRIVVKDPPGRVQVKNDSQNSVCYISIKKIREYNQQPYYDWVYVLDIPSQSKREFSVLPGLYTIRVSDCNGTLLSRSEIINVGNTSISSITVDYTNSLKIEYDKDADREICFLYLNRMTNPSIGDDFLSSNFVLPGNTMVISLPEGKYKVLIEDCYDRLIYQDEIVVTGSPEQEFYIPFPKSLLKINTPNNPSICELYVSTDLDTFKGADLSSYMERGIPLVEGYYDIQVNYCDNHLYLLDKPQIFNDIYISGDYLFIPTDPRPWILRYLMENPNQIPWILGMTICGSCGIGLTTLIFILISFLKKRRLRRNQ